ncbi:MAG: hypothetical protein HXY25_10225 [Alphaproteobacteria bacterium]|nr:hypothetical protein [Alphaproteobacteria bacterium]
MSQNVQTRNPSGIRRFAVALLCAAAFGAIAVQSALAGADLSERMRHIEEMMASMGITVDAVDPSGDADRDPFMRLQKLEAAYFEALRRAEEEAGTAAASDDQSERIDPDRFLLRKAEMLDAMVSEMATER